MAGGKPHGGAGVPARLPATAAGLKVGLFGGSFDPPHAAHRAASLLAMKRLGLDFVWWLVTPGNPLKATAGLPPLEARLAAARALARHPRIKVSGIEAEIGTRYTFDTLAYLTRRCPGVRLVWIMGADNLAGFHRWQHWRDIADLLPIAVVDRGGAHWRPLAAPAARALARNRLAEDNAHALAGATAPAWVFLHGLKSPLSSTALRQRQRRPATLAQPTTY
ncbi:nicotinate-nucleotide adenylyltransferase [Blastochloris viridis]|uniref:Probable nicotinate-nucleotide adenylyltransferase n=1 Tax=Blastochloris viridis TaxID=1079 RepID=A0A182D137_BLAVI|nr:nicotinate-nucleotide adenylyltransferase [Blastochloris viridis]